MSTRLNHLLMEKKKEQQKCLSIFLTAGFPNEKDTVEIVRALADGGVDFIELGIPFQIRWLTGQLYRGVIPSSG
jgi:tryptophan synthase alpha subunit